MRAVLRPWHLIAAAAAALFVLDRPGTETAPGPRPWLAPEPERSVATFPRAVPAAGGRTASIPRRPVRIVAASVASAEILVEIAPRTSLAGITYLALDRRYSSVAERVDGLPIVGGAPEQLVGVRPDLVVLDDFTRAETPILLQAAGVATVRTMPANDFAAVAANVRLLGWATGCDRGAEQLVAAMDAALARLSRRAPELRDWRIMNLNAFGDTYGADSLLDAVITAAGARNTAAEHGVGGYQHLDAETVLAWAPDALIVGVEPEEVDRPAAWLGQHPALALLPCVARGRIVHVPSALLGSTSTRVVELAEFVQRRLLEWGER